MESKLTLPVREMRVPVTDVLLLTLMSVWAMTLLRSLESPPTLTKLPTCGEQVP